MRKNGELVEVSWDAALNDIAVRLRSVVDEYGSHAVGMYLGSGLGLDSAGYSMEEAFWQALDKGPKFSPLTNDTTAKVMMADAMGNPKPQVYTSHRQRNKFNGQVSFLGEVCDCLISPKTAAEYSIKDGQKIRVFNPSGELTVIAKIDPNMKHGVCSIPHGYQDSNINNLTSTWAIDPLGGMAHYSAVPISIEPIVT